MATPGFNGLSQPRRRFLSLRPSRRSVWHPPPLPPWGRGRLSLRLLVSERDLLLLHMGYWCPYVSALLLVGSAVCLGRDAWFFAPLTRSLFVGLWALPRFSLLLPPLPQPLT